MQQIKFTVTLDYGDEGPKEGEPCPNGADVARWIIQGMAKEGWTSVDVSAERYD